MMVSRICFQRPGLRALHRVGEPALDRRHRPAAAASSRRAPYRRAAATPAARRRASAAACRTTSPTASLPPCSSAKAWPSMPPIDSPMKCTRAMAERVQHRGDIAGKLRSWCSRRRPDRCRRGRACRCAARETRRQAAPAPARPTCRHRRRANASCRRPAPFSGSDQIIGDIASIER